MTKSCRPFFTLTSSTSTLRKGKINASGMEVETPCLFIRTSRFLPPHLTSDNLNHSVQPSSVVLEMNFDHLLENEEFAKSCPITISEIAGVRGAWLTCLSTRLRSESDSKSSMVINGDDFVTIHNATGSTRFEMNSVPSLLSRFKPDFAIVPFDEHQIPISAKRVKKAVDRSLKYEKVFAEACKDLYIPFISPAIGADVMTERERSVQQVNEMSSGFAYCDLNAFDFDKKDEILKASKVSESSFRIIRGPITPVQVVKLIRYADAFDSSFVDDITAKGLALQLDFPSTGRNFDEGELEKLSCKDYLNLWDEKYFDDFNPLSDACTCPCCKNYKRSYIHHLLQSHEMLAGVLLMMHNLHQYNKWISALRSLE